MHLLEIRIQAIQLSPYHAGPSAHHSLRLDMAAGFLACSCPLLAFRPQLSHQTQKPPSEFLPTELGIQQGASWRTRSRPPTSGPNTVSARACCLRQQRCEALHRTEDADVVDVDASLRSEFFHVTVGEPEAQIPTHRQSDHLRRKPEPSERRRSTGRRGAASHSHEPALLH